MTRWLILPLLLVALDVRAQPAEPPVCNHRPAIIKKWAEKFEEVPVAAGLNDRGNVMEVLASPSGTWTLLETQPNGLSCLAGTGYGWTYREPPAPAVPERVL
ncbi:MAG TPA: hypothetical protein VEA41_13840 [Salinarimonas sp.]|nr:hypothetical protein [Salinarimonas sp.]